MKKYFAMMALAAMSLCVFSCGDDDESEGGGSGGGSGNAIKNAGVLDHNPNSRLTRAGDYYFFYDSKGRVDYITEYGKPEMTFEYNPNRIIGGESDYEEVASVSYNGNGYLTSLKSNYEWVESKGTKYEETITGSGTVTFTYDGSGHLTGATSTSKEKIVRDDKTRNYDANVKVTVTWKSNMLVQVMMKGTETEKDDEGIEKESWTETWNYTYDQEDLIDNTNKHHQYVHSVTDWIDDFECLAFVGIFGRGPLYLPTAATCTEVDIYDDETEEEERSYTYRYTFNDDESVNTCMVTRKYNSSYKSPLKQASSSDKYQYEYEKIGDNDDDDNASNYGKTRGAYVVTAGHNAPVADIIRSLCRRK